LARVRDGALIDPCPTAPSRPGLGPSARRSMSSPGRPRSGSAVRVRRQARVVARSSGPVEWRAPYSVRRPRRSHQGDPCPCTAPTAAYVRAPGARPCDGDAVRRSVPLAARAAVRRSATCGTVRRPTGLPRTGIGPNGTGPGSLLRLGAVVMSSSRGPGAGTGGARPVEPPCRTAAWIGGGGDGVRAERRSSRRAAGLLPLAASKSAAAPPCLSPIDSQLGDPICAVCILAGR
jgi:hypothetical protein